MIRYKQLFLTISAIMLLLSTVQSQAYVSSNSGDKYINESGEATMSPTADLIIVKLGMQFQLKVNQTAIIEPTNIKVKFVKVTEDSRCPSGAQCVWEGKATISVNIRKDNQNLGDLTLSISPGGGNQRIKTFDRYIIELVDLEPYPKTSEPSKPSNYVANLLVSEMKQGHANAQQVSIKASTPVSDPDAHLFPHASLPIIASWNLEKEKGLIVMVTRDNNGTLTRSILRFTPMTGNSTSYLDWYVEGLVTYSDSDLFKQGDRISLQVGHNSDLLFLLSLDKPGYGVQFVIYKVKTKLMLGEEQKDGPLLVQEIGPDRVVGLQFREFPVATVNGMQITLHVGESVSNGCNVKLTLLSIHDKMATFLETIEMHKRCPI